VATKRSEIWRTVFVDCAEEAFAFLVSAHGFIRLHTSIPDRFRSPQDLWHVPFGKNQIIVAPSAEPSGPVTTLIYPRHGDGTQVEWAGLKKLYMLERMRCPHERFSPKARDDHSEAGFRRICAHDARVIRDYFPDILDGRVDLLALDNLDEVQKQLH
jgi:hypothetical protein